MLDSAVIERREQLALEMCQRTCKNEKKHRVQNTTVVTTQLFSFHQKTQKTVPRLAVIPPVNCLYTAITQSHVKQNKVHVKIEDNMQSRQYVTNSEPRPTDLSRGSMLK